MPASKRKYGRTGSTDDRGRLLTGSSEERERDPSPNERDPILKDHHPLKGAAEGEGAVYASTRSEEVPMLEGYQQEKTWSRGDSRDSDNYQCHADGDAILKEAYYYSRFGPGASGGGGIGGEYMHPEGGYVDGDKVYMEDETYVVGEGGNVYVNLGGGTYDKVYVGEEGTQLQQFPEFTEFSETPQYSHTYGDYEPYGAENVGRGRSQRSSRLGADLYTQADVYMSPQGVLVSPVSPNFTQDVSTPPEGSSSTQGIYQPAQPLSPEVQISPQPYFNMDYALEAAEWIPPEAMYHPQYDSAKTKDSAKDSSSARQYDSDKTKDGSYPTYQHDSEAKDSIAARQYDSDKANKAKDSSYVYQYDSGTANDPSSHQSPVRIDSEPKDERAQTISESDPAQTVEGSKNQRKNKHRKEVLQSVADKELTEGRDQNEGKGSKEGDEEKVEGAQSSKAETVPNDKKPDEKETKIDVTADEQQQPDASPKDGASEPSTASTSAATTRGQQQTASNPNVRMVQKVVYYQNRFITIQVAVPVGGSGTNSRASPSASSAQQQQQQQQQQQPQPNSVLASCNKAPAAVVVGGGGLLNSGSGGGGSNASNCSSRSKVASNSHQHTNKMNAAVVEDNTVITMQPAHDDEDTQPKGLCARITANNSTLAKIVKVLQDNRLDTDDPETSQKLKEMNKSQHVSSPILKKILNIIFVTTGVALLLAVVVVIIYSSIGNKGNSEAEFWGYSGQEEQMMKKDSPPTDPPDDVYVIELDAELDTAENYYEYPSREWDDWEPEEEEDEYVAPVVLHNFDEYEAHQNNWDTLWQEPEVVEKKDDTDPTTDTGSHLDTVDTVFGTEDTEDRVDTEDARPPSYNTLPTPALPYPTRAPDTIDFFRTSPKPKPPLFTSTTWMPVVIPVDIEEVRRAEERRRKEEEQRRKEKQRKQKERERNVIDREQYKEDQYFDRHIERPPHYIEEEKLQKQKNNKGKNKGKQKVSGEGKDSDQEYYEYEQYQDDFFQHNYHY